MHFYHDATGVPEYENLLNVLSSFLGLAAGEFSKGILVHRSSKLATQYFPATSGTKLGLVSRHSSFFQLTNLNHLWLLISSLPLDPLPRRLLTSFCNNWRGKLHCTPVVQYMAIVKLMYKMIGSIKENLNISLPYK